MRCVVALLTWVLLVVAPHMASGQERVIELVESNDFEVEHPPQHATDKNLTTRWSTTQNNSWIRFDLGMPQAVSQVFVAWYQGEATLWAFDIELSNDRINWNLGGARNQINRMESGMEVYDFPEVTARYVRIVAQGNLTTGAEGGSIVEARVHGFPERETLHRVSVVSVGNIDQQEGRPLNTTDSMLATHWSGTSTSGNRPFIQYDMGTVVRIDRVFAAWFKGSLRQASYMIEVSLDEIPETWTEVIPDRLSSGVTPGLESNEFEATMARHLRIVGTNPSDPLALNQVEIHGPLTPPAPDTVSVFCIYPLKAVFQNLCDQF